MSNAPINLKNALITLNVGTYIDTSPVNVVGVSRSERTEYQSDLNRDLELVFRKMYFYGWIQLDIYNPLITDLPTDISSLTGMSHEVKRLIDILEVPSCAIPLNYKYKIWKNVCAIIMYRLLGKLHYLGESHANVINKTIINIRGIMAKYDSEIPETLTLNLSEIQVVKKVTDILSICETIEKPYLRATPRYK